MSYSCAGGGDRPGAVAADSMWEADFNAGYAVANGDIIWIDRGGAEFDYNVLV
jgi:hypothetical protein